VGRPRIAIVHTGGTLGMAEPEMRRLDLAPRDHLDRLLQRVPELGEIAEIDLVAPWNLDSSDVGPPEWSRPAEIVAGRLKADGPDRARCSPRFAEAGGAAPCGLTETFPSAASEADAGSHPVRPELNRWWDRVSSPISQWKRSRVMELNKS